MAKVNEVKDLDKQDLRDKADNAISKLDDFIANPTQAEAMDTLVVVCKVLRPIIKMIKKKWLA